MTNKIGIFALFLSLLTQPMMAQFQQKITASPVGWNVDKMENDDYFKPKKKKKKKKKGESESDFNLQDRLWYGANGTLGGGSSNQQSQFAVGLQPMVGYKLVKWVSAGPRLGLIYQLDKYPVGNFTISQNTWVKTAGVFARLRFWNLFIHGEASHNWVKASYKEPVTREKRVFKEQSNNQYIGLGWNEGREKTMGYEFMILVNVQNAKDPNYQYVPIEVRGGLTYNF
jgi:hypothetical protein